MFKAFILSLTILTSNAFAQRIQVESKILKPSELKQLIGKELPERGSAAEARDFEILFKYQELRSPNDCALAAKDVDTSIGAMFGGDNKILTDAEVKEMESFLFKVYASTGINIYVAKKVFKRPRPYTVNANIKPCIKLEESYAFPSGHALMVRVYAQILAKVYPERAQQFLIRSNKYAINRVIGGVHHPSDVQASAILGDYLAGQMIRSRNFQEALKGL